MQFIGDRKANPWLLEGKRVKGLYLDQYEVVGTVAESRVRYGGFVQHNVKLDTPIVVDFDSSNPLRHTVHILDTDVEEHNELQEILD